MAQRLRSIISKAHLSVIAALAAAIAGVGVALATSAIDKKSSRGNTLTINGVPFKKDSIPFTVLDQASVKKFVYLKRMANKLFLTQAAASDRFVAGDGSVRKGSRLVGQTKETVLTVPETLRVEAATGNGKEATVTLNNLTAVDLMYASTAPNGAGGGTQSGLLPAVQSEAILIGLLQPTTVQIIPPPGDDAGLHTLTFTAYGQPGGQVQVVGHAISG